MLNWINIIAHFLGRFSPESHKIHYDFSIVILSTPVRHKAVRIKCFELESVADEEEGCPVVGMGEVCGDAVGDVAAAFGSEGCDRFLGDLSGDECFLGGLDGGSDRFALFDFTVEGIHKALGAAVVDCP